MAEKAKKKSVVELLPADIRTVEIEIVGTSPLIVHNWDEKNKQKMRDKHAHAPKKPRPTRDPAAECEAALYCLDDGRCGVPAAAWKQAAVRAGKLVGVVMTDARQMFFVRGEYSASAGRELVPIVGEWEQREDVVRVSSGGTDLRYRPCFREWSATLRVEYDAGLITEAQIANLIERSGRSVGVCEWRPEKDGEFGCFEIRKKAE